MREHWKHWIRCGSETGLLARIEQPLSFGGAAVLVFANLSPPPRSSPRGERHYYHLLSGTTKPTETEPREKDL